MVQLNILSGKKAGDQPVARHFPFRIGRAEENNLQLEDDGVWERHLSLEFRRNEGFLLTTAPDALATVNQQPVQSVVLRNGDIVAASADCARANFSCGRSSPPSPSPKSRWSIG
jgi:pSer/pThr/pTyr-binding forkhead associated (FHA) protein